MSDKELITKLIQEFGKQYSTALGIDLTTPRSEEIFKWFLSKEKM